MNRKPFAGTMLPAKSRVTQVVVMMVFAVVALSGAFANSNQTRQVTKSEFTTPAPSPTPPPQEWVELDIIAPQQTVEVTTRADHYTARFQHRAKVYPNGRANGMLELTTPRGELVRYDSFYGTGVYKSTDSGKTWLQVMLRLRRASAPRGDEITVMLRPAPSPSGPGATGNVYTVTFGGSLSGSFAANYQIKIRLRDDDGTGTNVGRQNSVNSAGSRPAGERRPTAATPATQDLATGQQPTFDRRAFEDSLHAAVAPNVMGYTFLLIKEGRVVAEGAGGLARNAADGQMKMTTNTPQNMGSLFKFVTGVTVLHLLDRPPAGSAGGNNTFETRLDAPVALLYPQLWNAGIKTPTIRNITFRHLLQHRSGFRGCSTPLGCFGKRYNTTLFGVREYENINFQLLGFLIPLYTNPELNQGLNAVAKTVPEDEGDHHIQMVLSDRMDRFLHQTMFPLAPGKISASCDAENEYRATGAYGYVSKSDTGKGIITSRKAGGKPCVGSGGYWMSIRDFGSFVAAALHSDRMLSEQARLEMYRTGMPADDRLVWSFTTSDPWISDKFKMSTIIWSNGIQPYDGGQSFNTVLLRLPLNYELMVFVNSGGMGVDSLASAGLKAFRAGMEP